MTNVERQTDGGGPNIIDTMARFLLRQLKMADMDEYNRVTLSDYLGLMYEDPKLKDVVYTRMNQLLFAENHGRKIPLYTDADLTMAQHAFQPPLFDERIKEGSSNSGVIFESDPEKKLGDLHKNLQGRFTWEKDKTMSKDIREKKRELREIIGLPVARGKSEHVNDRFYKFLVRRIVNLDTFGIFSEFDRAISEKPPELESKICEVKGLVAELLGGELNQRERFQRFYEFSREYTEKWVE